jgi:antitoxin (DNA-binding transcriptional repressor) of toxin-antitoxin stability system
MYKVDRDQVNHQIESLLQAALNGDEVMITQNDLPILKLVSVLRSPKRCQSGSDKGLIGMSPDFDQSLEDFREYM